MADSSPPTKPGPSADSGASAEQAKRGLLPVLGAIGNLRDTLLVGAGTVYILGYLTWSISAYSEGLGLLPALEAQYFMGGIVPAAILGMVLLLLFNLVAVNAFMHRLFGPEKAILKGAFRYMAIGCLAFTGLFVMLVLLSALLDSPRLLGRVKDFGVVFALAGFAAVVAIPFVIEQAPRDVGEWVPGGKFPLEHHKMRMRIRQFMLQYMSKAQLVYLTLVFSGLGLWSYGLYFENLPQEFGGIGKRCAYLDFRVDQVSRETLESLTRHLNDPARAAPPAKVVRSRRVEVIFKASTVILVEAGGSRHELTPAIVRAITWCPAPKPARSRP